MHPKKSADDTGLEGERWSCVFPATLLNPAPLAPCGRGVGGEGARASEKSGPVEQKGGGSFLGSAPKNSPSPKRLIRFLRLLCDAKYTQKTLCRNFPSPRMLQQTEKNSVGIRIDVAILGLGRNSGTSGDFQLTRSAPCLQDTVFSRRRVFKTLIADVFSWTNPDVCQVDGQRPAIRPPEANGGGVSASRFAGAGCLLARENSSDRCRKRVIAPLTESLRWPETPSSVRQIPLGKMS